MGTLCRSQLARELYNFMLRPADTVCATQNLLQQQIQPERAHRSQEFRKHVVRTVAWVELVMLKGIIVHIW
jgi:hypothetical protein